jgi:hypothetical protein
MQGINVYTLMNKRFGNLDIVGYPDIVLARYVILRFPNHVKYPPSHVELYHGKAPNLY